MMPHNRFYLDAELKAGSILSLSEEEAHHLIRVLRAEKGERIEVINGRGELATAKILEVKKREAIFCVESISCRQPPPPLILAQAIPRMNHLEWIIEKGTELNATAFWLFPGKLGEKQDLSKSQKTRLENLCISAMKQCGRLDLPEIVLKTPLLEWDRPQGTLFFGDTSENAPYLGGQSAIDPLPLILFIGPEKGFSKEEHSYLQTDLKATGFRLHCNILRTETASLTALVQCWELLKTKQTLN